MKIESRPIVAPRASNAAQAAPAGGFAVKTGAEPAPAGASVGISALAAPSALLALQLEEERRSRRIRTGERTLDTLDALRAEILSGRAGSGVREELAALAAEAGEPLEEPGLEETLSLIRQRAAVELAKLERRARGGGSHSGV